MKQNNRINLTETKYNVANYLKMKVQTINNKI